MAQHTPGPWTYEPNAHCGYDQAIVAASGDVIAAALHKPDARLIAAAPALYEALRGLVASLAWEEKRSGTTYAGYDAARAALAAVDGGKDSQSPSTDGAR